MLNMDSKSQSLFYYLTSYVPTEKRESKEDFLTQAFAWILVEFPPFTYYYLDFLNEKLYQNTKKEGIKKGENYKYMIETQRQLDGGHSRLDLLINIKLSNGKKVHYICEHKVESELSENQISRYMSLASEIDNDKSSQFYSVLLTKNTKQHTQYADVRIVWGDIKELIDSFLQDYTKGTDKEYIFILKQLSLYLTEKGLEKAKPIVKEDLENHNFEIKGFKKDSYIEKTLNYFVYRLAGEIEDLIEQDKLVSVLPNIKGLSEANIKPTVTKSSWGRKGINIFGNEWDSNKSYNDVDLFNGAWKVGLFVGFLFNPTDHELEDAPDREKGFDMVIIMDGKGKDKLRKKVLDNKTLKYMTDNLQGNSGDFSFIPFEELKNPFRLAVLRKPFMDVLCIDGEFQNNVDTQYELFKKNAIEGINLMADAYSG